MGRRLLAVLVLLATTRAVTEAATLRARLPRPRNGLQVRLSPIEIKPHTEREVCQLVTLRNAKPIDARRLSFAMPYGRTYTSHHFAVFLSEGGDSPALGGPPFDSVGCTGTGDTLVSPILAFVQRPRARLAFPRGVGVTLHPHQRLLLNSHYINDGDAPITVDVAMNFDAARRGSIVHHARSFQLGTLRIDVPPFQRGSARATWRTPFPMNVVWMSSHSHKHTESVEVDVVRAGLSPERALVTEKASDPTIRDYKAPFLRLNPGDGIQWTCNYNNPTARPLTFGVTSNDEMCFALGFFFPDDDAAPLPRVRGCFGNGDGLVCPLN